MRDLLDSYCRMADQIPVISIEEQRRLFLSMKEGRDSAAEQTLIRGHLRYVVNIARGYLKFKQPFADLIQEGNIGLINAVREFKPGRGGTFHSLAVRWINLEICQYILRNWCIVATNLAKEQLNLFMRMRRFRAGQDALTASEIKLASSSLGVPVAEIQRLERRLEGRNVSLEAESGVDDPMSISLDDLIDGNDGIAALEDTDWNERRLRRMSAALTSLDRRSRDVISLRWLASEDGMGFREISIRYSVSSERIRRIQQRAFGIMRKVVA